MTSTVKTCFSKTVGGFRFGIHPSDGARQMISFIMFGIQIRNKRVEFRIVNVRLFKVGDVFFFTLIKKK